MNPSEHIDKQIASYPDWRGKLLAKLRKIVHEADPEIVEDWKWETAVFTHNGMVCALGAFKDHVKINFLKGAALADQHKLLNSGLESKVHRAIDFAESDSVDEAALKDLIREAVAHNVNVKK